MSLAYVVRVESYPPSVYGTVDATAHALLAAQGRAALVTVLMPGHRERDLTDDELRRLREAISEARTQVANSARAPSAK